MRHIRLCAILLAFCMLFSLSVCAGTVNDTPLPDTSLGGENDGDGTVNDTPLPDAPLGGGKLGDVNGDSKVDSTDARMVLQHFVGALADRDLDLNAAEMDGDGKVDSTDARLILQYFVGSIKEFPNGDHHE